MSDKDNKYTVIAMNAISGVRVSYRLDHEDDAYQTYQELCHENDRWDFVGYQTPNRDGWSSTSTPRWNFHSDTGEPK
jgi:hypothetical protein